jgi:hypothetical protein
MKKLQEYIRLQSGTAYICKMDIAKYFYRVDHEVLIDLWKRVIKDWRALWLLSLTLPKDIPCGMDLDTGEMINGVGMPIGNLPSQMHANFNLNPLDQFIKHELKAKYYIRYMDDMCIVGTDKQLIRNQMEEAEAFARKHLRLQFNHKKTCIRTEAQGIDFCCYRVWRDHIRLRKKTALRMKHHLKWLQKQFALGNLNTEQFDCSLQSHLGQMQHCDSCRLMRGVLAGIVLKRAG